MGAAQRHDDLTLDTIHAALFSIDATVSREKWVRIGMALKSELGEPGFGLFDEWSRTGEGYDARDCRDTWRSIRPSGGVNIGTLIYEAQQNGFHLNDNRPTLDAAQIEARRRQREGLGRLERLDHADRLVVDLDIPEAQLVLDDLSGEQAGRGAEVDGVPAGEDSGPAGGGGGVHLDSFGGGFLVSTTLLGVRTPVKG